MTLNVLHVACSLDSGRVGTCRCVFFFFFFFILVTGRRRSLSLKLSETRVYEPQIRARLGTTDLAVRATPGGAGGRMVARTRFSFVVYRHLIRSRNEFVCRGRNHGVRNLEFMYVKDVPSTNWFSCWRARGSASSCIAISYGVGTSWSAQGREDVRPPAGGFQAGRMSLFPKCAHNAVQFRRVSPSHPQPERVCLPREDDRYFALYTDFLPRDDGSTVFTIARAPDSPDPVLKGEAGSSIAISYEAGTICLPREEARRQGS